MLPLLNICYICLNSLLLSHNYQYMYIVMISVYYYKLCAPISKAKSNLLLCLFFFLCHHCWYIKYCVIMKVSNTKRPYKLLIWMLFDYIFCAVRHLTACKWLIPFFVSFVYADSMSNYMALYQNSWHSCFNTVFTGLVKGLL